MSLVITLIANPARRTLDRELADRAMASAGASSVDWLADQIACDIVPARGLDRGQLRQKLDEILEGSHIDYAVQASAGRRKSILVADMDSTMIEQECIDELADEIGIKDKVAEITTRSMNGEIAFEPALRERVALLRDLDENVIGRIIAERITPTPGGRTLVATMRAHGAWTALVSGGFTAFTDVIASRLGFDESRGNRLIIEAGRLTGKVGEPVLGREAKALALSEIAASRGLSTEDSIAVGDGANDLDMLALAGTGVALHAKPAVAAQTDIRIDYGDLTALLYLQGYRQSEFVE